MNKKLEEYQVKANRIVKTITAIGIAIFILAILLSIIYFTINKPFIENNQSAEVIDEDDFDNSGTGTIYYVAEDGTSEEGTDINDPMSLETANNKQFKGNDSVLFKCGDTFYGRINFSVTGLESSLFYIGSYGEGEKPIISGARILKNKNAWQLEKGLYKIDLSNDAYFEGIGRINEQPYNIGFIADEEGNIYGARKESKELLENEFDFYCESNYLYLKCSQSPTELLGKIKFVSNLNLVRLSSNTILDNLNIQYTGAHGISKKNSATTLSNVIIKNCVIQNIGGSLQEEETFVRYGNGIEFWLDASNIQIENNIIRNCYDAGFTLQGTSGEWRDVIVKDNVLIQNCYSIELWGAQDSTGMYNIQIFNNICINQGKRLGSKC